MKKSLLFGIVVGALFFAGCSQNVARFSVASTGNLPLQNVKKGDYVKGKDCIWYLFGWPLGNTQNSVSGAVAKALEVAAKKDKEGVGASDALVKVDVSASFWTLLIIGKGCYTAKGQPITTH